MHYSQAEKSELPLCCWVSSFPFQEHSFSLTSPLLQVLLPYLLAENQTKPQTKPPTIPWNKLTEAVCGKQSLGQSILPGTAASVGEEQWSLLEWSWVSVSSNQGELGEHLLSKMPGWSHLIACANSTENAVLGMMGRAELKAKLLISYEILKSWVSTNSEHHLTDVGNVQSS